MSLEETRSKIKEMLIRRLKLKVSPEEISYDMPLFGGALDLDSIDALEIVVALQKEFDCVITDKAAAEKILVSVNTIADFMENKKVS